MYYRKPQIKRSSRGTNSCYTVADKAVHGLISTEVRKLVTRYDKWLSYGGDYVEMQWDGGSFRRKEFLLQLKMKNPKYILRNYIYIYIYDLCISCGSSCCITVKMKLRFFVSTNFHVHDLFKIFHFIYTATSSLQLDTLVKRFNENFILNSINRCNKPEIST